MRLAALVRSLLFFGLFGPPLGGIVFTLTATGLNGIYTLPIVMLLSYVFGFVPALLVGVVAATTSSKITGLPSILLLTACGAAFSVMFIALTGDLQNDPVSLDWDTLKLTVAPGAASAFVLACILRLRPNNSFKPRPLRGSAAW